MVLPFYVPLTKKEEKVIWDKQRDVRQTLGAQAFGIAEDELVEDAQLSDGDEPAADTATARQKVQTAELVA